MSGPWSRPPPTESEDTSVLYEASIQKDFNLPPKKRPLLETTITLPNTQVTLYGMRRTGSELAQPGLYLEWGVRV
jgi:hypothetical protein